MPRCRILLNLFRRDLIMVKDLYISSLQIAPGKTVFKELDNYGGKTHLLMGWYSL
jgi:hypothetical protein